METSCKLREGGIHQSSLCPNLNPFLRVPLCAVDRSCSEQVMIEFLCQSQGGISSTAHLDGGNETNDEEGEF